MWEFILIPLAGVRIMRPGVHDTVPARVPTFDNMRTGRGARKMRNLAVPRRRPIGPASSGRREACELQRRPWPGLRGIAGILPMGEITQVASTLTMSRSCAGERPPFPCHSTAQARLQSSPGQARNVMPR